MTALDILKEWFDDEKESYHDVIIAGRTFGGRHGMWMLKPREYSFDDTTLLIRFGTTEVLTVENPSGFERGEFGQLIIPSATQAVFGHHNYGREQTPENWCEQIYERNDSQVKLTRTGPSFPGVEEFSYVEDRFVEIR